MKKTSLQKTSLQKTFQWISEEFESVVKTSFKIKKVLFNRDSDFQNVKIVKTVGFGNMLINDGHVMTCEKDEYIYHEMISHVPLFMHKNPKDILIIGGGDGGTAREVLKHKNIKSCTLVEIDPVVIEACKKHLKIMSCSLNHPKLQIKIMDGAKMISQQNQAYDVIIVDSSDPIGPASVLFSKSFYKNIYKALKKDGLVVAQSGDLFYQNKLQKHLVKISKQQGFNSANFYSYTNLTYPNSLWSFLLASKGNHSLKNFQDKKINNSKLSFRYYNACIHRASFAMPECVKKQLIV